MKRLTILTALALLSIFTWTVYQNHQVREVKGGLLVPGASGGLLTPSVFIPTGEETVSNTASSTYRITIDQDASTTPVDLLVLENTLRNTSGNSNTSGIGQLFRLEDSNGVSTTSGRIVNQWASSSSTTPSSYFSFLVKGAISGLTEVLRLTPTSTTLTNLIFTSATSTNATTTNSYISGSLLVNSASSTITNLWMNNSTTTNATTTNFNISGTLTANNASSIGWNAVAGADTACNTTCTFACVAGFANAASGQSLVACTDATADSCLCAGTN